MTDIQTSCLSRPLHLPRGQAIKNRICKSAMSEALAGRDGVPPPSLRRLYAAWAAGGAGLCITGNVMIDHRALGEPGNVVLEDAGALEAFTAWAQAATASATHCWVQLNHPGKQAPKGLNQENVAPSAIPFRPEMQAMFPTPRELAESEILELIERFGKSAGLVRQAGFSGVQIHGAHGYLVSQFLSPHHNQRTDAWGGSPANRRRFVLEVYQAMRKAVGDDFPIGIKLNSADFQRGGFTEEESLEVIRALADAGIDLIEISGGTYEAPVMTGVRSSRLPAKESTRQREAYFLEFAEKVRLTVPQVPLVVTGGFRSAAGMEQALQSGAVDMVGVARILAIEPDAPARLLQGMDPVHAVRPIRTGIRMVDRMGIMEISWYTRQLKRIGLGLPPKPDESGLVAFLHIMWQQLRSRRKQKLQRLRAH